MPQEVAKIVRRALIGALILGLFAVLPPSPQAATPEWQVCFTPGGQCTELILGEIAGARHSILVQAYSFTSVPILSALTAAPGRGVDVEMIVGKSSTR